MKRIAAFADKSRSYSARIHSLCSYRLAARARQLGMTTLAQQLIATKMNIANGSNPVPISAAVAAADSLLGKYSGKLPYKVSTNSADGKTLVTLGSALEKYNKSCGTGS